MIDLRRLFTPPIFEDEVKDASGQYIEHYLVGTYPDSNPLCAISVDRGSRKFDDELWLRV